MPQLSMSWLRGQEQELDLASLSSRNCVLEKSHKNHDNVDLYPVKQIPSASLGHKQEEPGKVILLSSF